MAIGEILVAASIIFLAIRLVLYKEKAPQMFFLTGLAMILMAFGAYFIMFPGITTTTSLSYAQNSISAYNVITRNVPLVCNPWILYNMNTYYFNSIPASNTVLPYNSLTLLPPAVAFNYITTATSNLAGATIFLHGFMTNITELDLNHTAVGIRQVSVYANFSGARVGSDQAHLFAQIWVVNAIGIPLFEIGQTTQTANLSNSIVEYDINTYLNQTFIVNRTHRKEVLLFANVTTGGATETLGIYSGNTYYSHLNLPSLVNASYTGVCPTTTEVSTSNSPISNSISTTAPTGNSWFIPTLFLVFLIYEIVCAMVLFGDSAAMSLTLFKK